MYRLVQNSCAGDRPHRQDSVVVLRTSTVLCYPQGSETRLGAGRARVSLEVPETVSAELAPSCRLLIVRTLYCYCYCSVLSSLLSQYAVFSTLTVSWRLAGHLAYFMAYCMAYFYARHNLCSSELIRTMLEDLVAYIPACYQPFIYTYFRIVFSPTPKVTQASLVSASVLV